MTAEDELRGLIDRFIDETDVVAKANGALTEDGVKRSVEGVFAAMHRMVIGYKGVSQRRGWPIK